MVAVLAGVQDAGDGAQGGLSDLGEYAGLLARLVPQDSQVECLEQPGLEGGRQGGQDVAGEGELVEQSGISGARCGLGQRGELGFDLLAFGVQVGEPAVDGMIASSRRASRRRGLGVPGPHAPRSVQISFVVSMWNRSQIEAIDKLA